MTTVLVTGGTGSFGQAFIRHALGLPELIGLRNIFDASETRTIPGAESMFDRVVVFSRDELKQHAMRQDGFTDPRLRWFIGDVRDLSRLERAFDGVDVVVHAAALKQVDTCEYNPAEAVKTNIQGTQNVIDAAIDCEVGKVLMIGTDKAVDPTNLYGASKLVAEKLIVDANVYAGKYGTTFASTRYGNVITSRGSVFHVFQAQHAAGQPLTITDPGMTRFVLTIGQAVDFVARCVEVMRGGEVFVPKIPAVTVGTIAEAISRHTAVPYLGLRPGEKRHELLVSEHEAHRTLDRGWHYLVKPIQDLGREWDGVLVESGFRYGSDTAPRKDVQGFRELAGLA